MNKKNTALTCILAFLFGIFIFQNLALAKPPLLKLYGIEIARFENTIDAFDYLIEHNEVKYMVWKSQDVLISSEQTLILSSYFTNLSDAKKALTLNKTAKLLSFDVAGMTYGKKNKTNVFLVPLATNGDSVFGDLWITQKNKPIRIEENLRLASFLYGGDLQKVTIKGLSPDQKGLIYCTPDCFLYDFKTQKKQVFSEPLH